MPPVPVPQLEVVPARIALLGNFDEDALKDRAEWRALIDAHRLKFVWDDDYWWLDTHLLIFDAREAAGLDSASQTSRVGIPDELYLRSFLDLDVNSPEAVGEFCAKVGPVGLKPWAEFYDSYDPPRDWPVSLAASLTAITQPAHLRSLSEPLLELDLWVNSELRGWDPQGSRVEQAGVRTETAGLSTEGQDVRWFGEVAVYQSFLRDMRNLWDFLSGGRSYAEVLASWTSGRWGWALPDLELDPALAVVPDGEDAAQIFLEDGLNPALSPFCVHVRAVSRTAAPSETARPEQEYTVYSAMCLQLANKIATGAPFRRCKNETCGRLFDEKQSFAPKHRSHGVTNYCSIDCANSQTQREHRRRKRDARRMEKSGSATVGPTKDVTRP